MFRNGLCIAVVGFNLAYGTWANQVFGQAAECATASTTASDAAVCGGCPCKGDCDAPGIRNQFVPSSLPTDMHMKVRVNINYFNEFMTTDIAAQRDKIIDDFRAHHIDLDVDLMYRDDSGYQTIDSQNECDDMKTAYADTTKLNVYVAGMDFLNGSLGRAVLPWESDALTDQGGVLVDVGAYGADRTTMTHEIGHALGLWHTSHGTTLSEMNNNHGTCTGGLCNCQCYESPDCSPDCDTVGDFCSDTPPTPGNSSCADPGGEENCTPYAEWDETHFENFMGFADDTGSPPFCRSQFTAQQGQRNALLGVRSSGRLDRRR